VNKRRLTATVRSVITGIVLGGLYPQYKARTEAYPLRRSNDRDNQDDLDIGELLEASILRAAQPAYVRAGRRHRRPHRELSSRPDTARDAHI
jgi:hypothetical protein